MLSDFEAWPRRIETVDVVEVLEEGRSRLTLSLDMRGPMIPFVALFSGLTKRYMSSEAQDMKSAAESAEA